MRSAVLQAQRDWVNIGTCLYVLKLLPSVQLFRLQRDGCWGVCCPLQPWHQATELPTVFHTCSTLGQQPIEAFKSIKFRYIQENYLCHNSATLVMVSGLCKVCTARYVHSNVMPTGTHGCLCPAQSSQIQRLPHALILHYTPQSCSGDW